MAKKYYLNGKAITADRAREIQKANQKLIDSGRIEDFVKCKVVCEAGNDGVTFGLVAAPKKPKADKPASAGTAKTSKPSTKKPAAKTTTKPTARATTTKTKGKK